MIGGAAGAGDSKSAVATLTPSASSAPTKTATGGAAPAPFAAAVAVTAAAPPPAKKTARFAAAVNAPSTVTLTPDGKLPELRLTEALSKAKRGEAKTGGNPLLLVAVFTVSAICSMLLLFWQPGGPPPAKSDIESARRELERFYQTSSAAPKIYQNLLRESQLANRRGDKKTERENYKRVLDMLHEEGRDKNKSSLTNTPSEDRDLNRLLGILLRQDEN